MSAVLVRGARQLVTLRGPSGPRRGAALRELGILENGAMLIRDGVVSDIGQGRRVENLKEARNAPEIDVSGRVVLPGFVDSHTYLVWGPPSQEDEAGSTPAVQLPPSRTLACSARERLAMCVRHGTTALEVKSGAALDRPEQTKTLRVTSRLRESALDLVSTYVGLHGVPAGFAGDYVEGVISNMLPTIARRGLARYADLCFGPGAFSEDDFRRYLQAARRNGLGAKVHSDGQANGSVRFALEMDAASLGLVGPAEERDILPLAESQTIATLLPLPCFRSNQGQYPSGRKLIDQGAAVALATGFTPDLFACNMNAVVSLACTCMGMTPAEAISAATINGAHALGLGNRLGCLQSGMQADLVVLDVPDYREIPYHFGVDLVVMTMKRGVVLYRRGEVQWPSA